MSYPTWPLLPKDKTRLEKFCVKLSETRDCKVSYGEAASLVFDSGTEVVDMIANAETALRDDEAKEQEVSA